MKEYVAGYRTLNLESENCETLFAVTDSGKVFVSSPAPVRRAFYDSKESWSGIENGLPLGAEFIGNYIHRKVWN